jgi:hypothetical protein
MKTTTWITLLAVGAILAFAIKRSPSFLNLQAAGWVLMATGGICAMISRQRRTQGTQNDEQPGTSPVSRDRPQVNRILVPGGVMSSRLGGTQPAGGQLQEEIIIED